MSGKRQISFVVTEEQYLALKEVLPYGMQRLLFTSIVEDLVPLLEEYGEMVILAFRQKQISFKGVVSEYAERHKHTELRNSISGGTDQAPPGDTIPSPPRDTKGQRTSRN